MCVRPDRGRGHERDGRHHHHGDGDRRHEPSRVTYGMPESTRPVIAMTTVPLREQHRLARGAVGQADGYVHLHAPPRFWRWRVTMNSE